MKASFILKTSAFLVILSGIVLFNGNTKAIGNVMVEPQHASSVSLENATFSALSADSPVEAIPLRQRSHAPEMPTVLLFLSGMVGMIVHAARVSFRAAKRALDYVISAVAILVASPLLIVIAILVKLTSKGPAIYRQERVGLNGKTFFIYKFRSMTVDAEKGTGAVWAKQNDPRVTPFGSFMRKTHLDELPQLFNVLKGEMSLVGPRPERPEMVKTLKQTICDYEKRLAVLPGITGLAQVRHRYDETLDDVRKKVKYDIFYIKKMCWLTEMRIVALTCVMMLTGKVLR